MLKNTQPPYLRKNMEGEGGLCSPRAKQRITPIQHDVKGKVYNLKMVSG